MVTAGDAAHGEVGLVGRDEELEFVAASLAQGGCVISGPAGVGKSRLAREAAAQHGAPVVRILATRAAGSVPFGAFGHLLARAPSDDRGPIPVCIDLLRQISPDRAPTIVLDDAHLLDAASAALVLALRESESARILATVRHGERVPDAITALWKDGWLGRLDLQPLSRRELRALVEAHLGAAAASDVHARVLSLTQGNPLYARELLLDARRSGALAEHDGCWQWTGMPPEMTRLSDLIAAHTQDLSAAARLALELLAVAGLLRLPELIAATNEAAVAELERAGLATVHGLPESAMVEVAHPLFVEVTLAALPAATAHRHRNRLAAALDRGDLADTFDVVRLAILKLESGVSDPALFLRAGAHALPPAAGVPGAGWNGSDPTLAIRLGHATGIDIDAALLEARGHMALSRLGEAENRLAPLEAAAAAVPFEPAAEYLRTRVYALHWSGNTEDALALLDRAVGWHNRADWRAVRATLLGWILFDHGRPQSAVEALGSLAHDSALAADIRLDALVLLVIVQSQLGLIDRCEALEPQIRELADELEQASRQIGWARYTVDGLARAEAARDLPAVAARLRKARDRAEADGNTALAGGLGMVLGRLVLTRGHARDAITVLEDAVHGLAAGDPRNGLGLALAHLTRAHALSGDCDAARGALAQAESVAAERRGRVHLELEVERARAWVLAAEGRLSAARDALLEVADAAGEAVAAEAHATYDAMRFGAPARQCARRLAALAKRTESELLEAWAQHAIALADADAAGQLAAAECFAQLGLDLSAAEAAAGAVRDFGREGRVDSARYAGALSAKHSAACEGAITPTLSQPLGGKRLTPREREIALLAARGHSNASIAQELVLSVRTVETYVLRACRKLGVERRGDLRDVLALGTGA